MKIVNKLSEKLTGKLLSNNDISEEEYELFVYGFYMMILYVAYFILVLVLGITFNCFVESIVFYVAFSFIRRFAGGYHAKTETRCVIC